jgi:tetratricopeptide (TPR) repeat protein
MGAESRAGRGLSPAPVLQTAPAPKRRAAPPRTRPDAGALHEELHWGETYYRMGYDAAAREHLEAFLRRAPQGPDSLRAAWLEARVLIRQGLNRRAGSLLRRLVRRPGTPAVAWHDWAQLMREDGFNDEAAMAEMKAVEESVADTLFLRSALAQWKGVGRPDQALQISALLLRGRSGAAEDYFQAGYLADCLGQKEEARSAYVSSLAKNPDHPEGHFNLAQILADEGQADSAEVHFKEVLRLRPSYEPTYFQLGALLLRSGKDEEARALFQSYLHAGTDSVALAQAEEILRLLDVRSREPEKGAPPDSQ